VKYHIFAVFGNKNINSIEYETCFVSNKSTSIGFTVYTMLQAVLESRLRYRNDFLGVQEREFEVVKRYQRMLERRSGQFQSNSATVQMSGNHITTTRWISQVKPLSRFHVLVDFAGDGGGR